MDYLQRVLCLYGKLKTRRYPTPLGTLAEALNCSERNTKSIISKLRGFGAPIEYDRERNGYYLDTRQNPAFELPGVWFNASELHALMTSYELLSKVQPGWLDDYIQPLKERIEKLFDSAARDFEEIQKRVRILQVAARETRLEHFQKVSQALVERRQLKILYHGRKKDVTTERTVSPQRLVYYRSNWYLDTWCHLSEAIRTFSLDRLHPVVILDERANEIDDAALDEHFTGSYGIFAGSGTNTAHLVFSEQAAKWVADEQWHPRQKMNILSNGRCELEVPYGDPTELIMDILKYGPDVEVLKPETLRDAVAQRARETAALYLQKNATGGN